MAVKLILNDATSSALIGDVASYVANVEAMPVDATSSSGSTWSVDLKAPATTTKIDSNGNRINLPVAKRSISLLGRDVSLIDYGMFYGENKADYGKDYLDTVSQSEQYRRFGAFTGKISSISLNNLDEMSLNIDSILFKFNCEKTAKPVMGGATQADAFIYYCSLCGITEDQVEIDTDFDVPIAYPGWKGNVWDYIKMFCVANMADLSVRSDGKIHLEKLRKRTISIDESSGLSTNITLLGTTRQVEIYDYSNSWETDTVIYASKTTFQLEMGETLKETVDVEVSTTNDKIIQPVCVKAIQPIPFKGGIKQSVYVVIDNLNYPVEPSWWNANGGKVTVTVSEENPMQLDIVIQAPNQPNSAYSPPYRLAEYDTDARPSLYVCGEGVVVKKSLQTVSTGADKTFISRDSKASVDNIFINNASYHLLQSAAFASGPLVEVNLTIPRFRINEELHTIAGSRFFYNNGFYRVASASISDSGISLNAKVDSIFSDFVSIYATKFSVFNASLNYNTFALFTTDKTGQKFGNFNDSYPAKTFSNIGSDYANMTFSDMTIVPFGDSGNDYVN